MKKFAVFHHHVEKQREQSSTLCLLLYTIAFLCCIIISITPLNRLRGLLEIQSWPTSALLLSIGSWLPIDLQLANTARDSQISTHLLCLLALIVLEFIIYGLAAWWIQQQKHDYDNRRTLTIIWFGVLAAGLIFVFTPAMLSRDLFVYAGYGRILAHYHANPYFVTLSTYPHDALVPLDDWNTALCAYGPIWLLICGLSSMLAGEHIILYVFFYRILGFAAHALNILLITTILRTMGRSPRTIVQGTLLYAWNPLVLQESCLGGHNDTFMVTFILLGLLFSVRAEHNKRRPFTAWHAYVPALIAFTVAVLIKFTSAPLIALFFILLACKLLQSQDQPQRLSFSTLQQIEWRSFLQTMLATCLVSVGTILAFYAPFWAGHSVRAILESFSSPPSARSAYGSILGAVLNWGKVSGGQYAGSGLIFLISQHNTWQAISTGVAALLLLISVVWLWHTPTTRTMALSALAILGAVLIVTPWFFPWYITWLVGLAAICLPVSHERIARALIGFTLTFSASAHFIYIFRGYQPIGDWIGWIFLTTIGPPLIILLLLLFIPKIFYHSKYE